MNFIDIQFGDGYFPITKTFNFNLDNNMWNNSGTWKNFGNERWSSRSSQWVDSHWNSFYGLGDRNNHIKKGVKKTLEDVQQSIDKTIKEINEIKKGFETPKKTNFRGYIVFTYIVDSNFTFRNNWDFKVKDLIESFNKIGLHNITINTDDAEFDRRNNKVTGIILFNLDLNSIKSSYKIKESDNDTIVEILHNSTFYTRNKYTIIFEKIYVEGKEVYNINNSKFVDENPTESHIKNPEAKNLINKINETLDKELNKPKWIKILDETKIRFRKRTFEMIKNITSIDDIPVNCLIVRQIRGDKDRKRYTLNANDCELLGIEYRDGLEILPNDLEFENVYKKVKNE